MSDRPTCMRFGPFELWRIERKLFADGRPALLGARAFDLLLALIEHRDRVVTKNELLQTVWPGQVVEEANLNVQVSGLRKVLGPQAIATIPGRGYRFALQLDESSGISSDSVQAARLLSPVNAIGDLPRLPGALLGRADDLVALERFMAQHRLVTLLGSGGIGKTTLALAAAHARERHHRDGVLWLELAQVSSAALLPSALAAALNIPPGAGDDPLRPLIAALKPLQILLVLDNAEHLPSTRRCSAGGSSASCCAEASGTFIWLSRWRTWRRHCCSKAMW